MFGCQDAGAESRASGASDQLDAAKSTAPCGPEQISFTSHKVVLDFLERQQFRSRADVRTLLQRLVCFCCR